MYWNELINKSREIPKLHRDDIHVWSVSSAIDSERLSYVGRVLSPDEWHRAHRFHFERDYRSFVVRRSALRELLARYCSREPSAIKFSSGPNGKPALCDTESLIRFSVSHSGERILFGFSYRYEIGVDIELVRRDLEFGDLSKGFFSPTEHAALIAAPKVERSNLFYEYWTCKEACLKADGRGLSGHLEKFTIQPASRQKAWREIVDHECVGLAPDFRIRIIIPDTGYVGAIARQGESWGIEFFS